MKTITAAIILTAATSCCLQAATIVWSTVTGATDADISTTGSLIEAANFGGTEVVANGVTFQAADFTGAYPLTTLTNLLYSTNGAGLDPGTGGNIDTIFSTVGVHSANQFPILTGLLIGQTYEIQIFLAHTSTGRTLTIYSTDNYTGPSASMNYEDAGIFTGTFTADATTQAMTWQESTGSNLTNGYQLRAIPEPSSLALIGLGGVALLLRRRSQA